MHHNQKNSIPTHVRLSSKNKVLVKSNTSAKIDCVFDGSYQVKDIKGNNLSLIKPGKSRRERPLIRDGT
uniref:DUF4968 domain-containing protein n=1 Tax=Strongyloides venezuelensis TaxID=75913 RepID=A0A0K0FJ81_STRVS